MSNPPLSRLRGWLARKGVSPQHGIYSRSIWGVRKSDIRRIESSEHGRSPGCDAWPIHVVLRELDKGAAFGFAHFNDGECRCSLAAFARGRRSARLSVHVVLGRRAFMHGAAGDGPTCAFLIVA